MPQASLGYVGVTIEATPGTGVAPAFYIPATDVSFTAPRDDQMIREIRGSRSAYTTLPGKIEPAVTLTTKVYPNLFMGVLLHAMFGGNATTVTTTTVAVAARKHIFSSGSPLPSLSFERSDARADGAGVVFERTAGHLIESMNFTAQFGEPLMVEVTTRGTGGIVTPGSKPVTFTYPSTAQMVNFTDAEVLLDGVSSPLFKSIKMNFTNTFDEQETLNKSLYPFKIYEGGMECTVTADIAYEASNALYTKWLSAANLSLRVKAQGVSIPSSSPSTPYEINFYFPSLKVKNFESPFTAGEVVNASVEFSTVFDDTLNDVAQIFLMNADTSGTYTTAS